MSLDDLIRATVLIGFGLFWLLLVLSSGFSKGPEIRPVVGLKSPAKPAMPGVEHGRSVSEATNNAGPSYVPGDNLSAASAAPAPKIYRKLYTADEFLQLIADDVLASREESWSADPVNVRLTTYNKRGGELIQARVEVEVEEGEEA